MNRIFEQVRANAIAYTALFVALGGSSYAAWNIPAGSISGRQIKNHVLDPVKLNPKYITQSIRAWASINKRGQVIASSPHAKILGSVGRDQVTWPLAFGRHCEPLVNVNNPTGPGGPSSPAFADASILPQGPDRLGVLVSTDTMAGEATRQPYTVAVGCPTPPK